MKKLLLIPTIPAGMALLTTPADAAQFAHPEIADLCKSVADGSAVFLYYQPDGMSGICVTARAEGAPFNEGQLLNALLNSQTTYNNYMNVLNVYDLGTTQAVAGIGNVSVSCHMTEWGGPGVEQIGDGPWGTYAQCDWAIVC